MNTNIAEQLEDLGIEGYLNQHQYKTLMRFLTCGSVDDGKSTLIGRLLHDSKQIYADQLAAVTSDSQKVGTTGEKPDLALLVDGLQAEREQGITIDVAYRYFSTQKRKFIIADTPGHEQYTRNMATGASTCDVAIILIDARKGVLDQTRRHSFISSLLGIRHFVVAINKMDLVGYSELRFEEIRQQYIEFAKNLNPDINIHLLPISALEGDNVVDNTDNLAWYKGAPLLSVLEDIDLSKVEDLSEEFRLPVQYVNRPNLDFRGFSGTLAKGSIKVGDSITALPSGKSSTVARIVTFDGDLESAQTGQAITITLTDEIDISRGDLLVPTPIDNAHLQTIDLQDEQLQTPKSLISQSTLINQSALIKATDRFLADVVWMTETPFEAGRDYNVKIAGKKTVGHLVGIKHQYNINQLEKFEATELPLNGIGLCEIALNEKVAVDQYQDCQDTGGFILIDRLSNVTVGAGMIRKRLESSVSNNDSGTQDKISAFEVELNALIRKHYPHWQAKDVGLINLLSSNKSE